MEFSSRRTMGTPCLLLGAILSFSFLFVSSNAAVHYHDFVVQATPVKRLCRTHSIITVNGQYPGPKLEARNGDTMVINVINRAKYNVTLHWHGIRQMRTAWADGPEYITQCPIRPGGSYTYRFTIEDQEGTLWWHAHSSWLRATVHGALIIYPREGSSYPFSSPNRELPVILGEWWNKDPVKVVRRAAKVGVVPKSSDAFTINGQPGDLYPCSGKETTVFPVAYGERNLFRFINAALNTELFISIAGHSMTVVGADAAYTKPFTTSVLMLGPGQTTDVLVTTNRPGGRYYVAARAYASGQRQDFDNTTTTAILEYHNSGVVHATQRRRAPFEPTSQGTPAFPVLPAYNDTATAYAFSSGIRSPGPVKVPGPVDEHLFFTVGLGIFKCPPNKMKHCLGQNGTRIAASMNNVSFQLPSTLSILQAHYLGVPGVFTADFPAVPPVRFDYTARNVSLALWQPTRGTKVLRLRYGTVVQLVFQGTNIISGEEHPMHIHGYNFYVLATGFGNFDPSRDAAKLNLVDPPLRNTIGVPVNGWAVVRFVADNPGVWLAHCHLDVHITWGLAMAFLVEDGVGKLQSLEPPPADLPLC